MKRTKRSFTPEQKANIANEIKVIHSSVRKTLMSLADEDRKFILKTKYKNPELRHR